MHREPDLRRQQRVAGDNQLLRTAGNSLQAKRLGDLPGMQGAAGGERHLLAVVNKRQACGLRTPQRLAHESRLLNAAPVVGERNGPGGLHCCGVGQFPPLASKGDGGRLQHAHNAPGLIPRDDIAEHVHRINRRCRVGHRENGGETAGGGGARAGGNILLVRLARFAQVYMQVEESRAQHQPLQIHHLDCGRCEPRPVRDHAVLDKNIPHQLPARFRIHHQRAAQNHFLSGHNLTIPFANRSANNVPAARQLATTARKVMSQSVGRPSVFRRHALSLTSRRSLQGGVETTGTPRRRGASGQTKDTAPAPNACEINFP